MAQPKPGDPVDISTWLTSVGFETEAAQATGRATLEAAGLTNPRKRAMAPEKLARARAVLEERLALLCDSCARHATRADSRPVVETSQPFCTICAGSNNRRAVEAMITACLKASVSRLLVVGGTGVTHRELQALLAGSGVEVRCIDGVERPPNKRDAIADLAWAEFMVIWASTPLPHKVSVSYTDACPPTLTNITVRRRSIEALCIEVTRSLAGRPRKR